jgi:hypothetical protein
MGQRVIEIARSSASSDHIGLSTINGLKAVAALSPLAIPSAV